MTLVLTGVYASNNLPALAGKSLSLMLNAKAAYAKGRRLVDANFVKLIEDCLKQVKDTEKLHLCKLFFEAFLGFYKELRPSDK